MNFADWLSLFGPGVVAAVAVSLQCGLLSPLVVLRRLAFMGQGVSHAAFGGWGIALALGLVSTAAFGVVAGFCIASALGIAWLSDRRTTSADTVIGVFLVGSMALGAALVSLTIRAGAAASGGPSWEDLLFGSLLTVRIEDAAIAWVAGAIVAALLAWWRRPMLFWAFDEPAAEAFGAPVGRMKTALMVMLAVVIVVTMKLSGVVLATALLIIPGAAALRMSARLGVVFALSCAVSLVGVLGGLALSFWLDLPPGACIVGALVAMFGATWAIAPAAKLRTPAATPPARAAA